MSKKYMSLRAFLISILLFMIPITIHASMLEKIDRQVRVSDSIVYKEITENYGTYARKYYIMEVDLNDPKNKIDVLINPSGFQKNMKMTEVAKKTPNTVAAINADFFMVKNGMSSSIGTLVKNKKPLSNQWSNQKHASMLIFDNNTVNFKYAEPYVYVKNLTKNTDTEIVNLNKATDNGLEVSTIFTSEYRSASLGKSPQRKDLVEVKVNQNGIVEEVRQDLAATKIPQGGYVIQAKGNQGKVLKERLSVGDQLQLYLKDTINNQNINTIISGGSILLKDGNKTPITHKASGNSQRSAIGITPDNKLIIFANDGRMDYVPGLTEELVQDIFLSKGIKDAIIFDGGGSTNFYFDGKMQNYQGAERLITNALAIMNMSDEKALSVDFELMSDMIFVNDEVEIVATAMDSMSNNISKYNTSYFNISCEGVDYSLSSNKRNIVFKSPGIAKVTVSIDGVSETKEVRVHETWGQDDKKRESISDSPYINVFGNMDAKADLIAEAINAKILEKINPSDTNIISFSGQDKYFIDEVKAKTVYEGYSSDELIGNTTVFGINNQNVSKADADLRMLGQILQSSTKNKIIFLNSGSKMPNKFLQHYFDKLIYENSSSKNIYVIYKTTDGVSRGYKRANASYISIFDTLNYSKKDINNSSYLQMKLDENGDLIYTFKKIF